MQPVLTLILFFLIFSYDIFFFLTKFSFSVTMFLRFRIDHLLLLKRKTLIHADMSQLTKTKSLGTKMAVNYTISRSVINKIKDE